MKICPTCNKNFEENIDFCSEDGEVLVYDLSSLVGQTLDGQYQIEALLGGGGMGAVYRARHIMLGDRVAIKVIRPDIGRSPEFLRRFRREGQAARRFRHPNAITVHDMRTTADGLTYMVLEYVEGGTLRDELDRRGRLSAREAFEILEPALNALAEAHSVGVIHRDLKPENIMIGRSPTGQIMVKVLDLGLAKIRQMPDMGGTAVTALTVGGQLLGTPFYMPPEQWGASTSDDDIDGRADIYSLGVVFYEMIAGGKPFKGKSIQELAREHAITDPQPLHLLRSDVPEAFSNAVIRAMAKDRDERYPTVAEFLSDLRAAVEKIPKSDKAAFLETAETIHFSSPNIAADTVPKKAADTVPNKLGKTVPDQPEIKIDDKIEDKKFEDLKNIAPIPPAPLPRTAPVGAIVAAALVVLSIVAWFVWKNLNPTVGPVHIDNDSAASSTETIEMMRYWLETESPVKSGPSSRAAGPVVLESGQGFKFHFSAREFGYIYIVGKGKGNAPTAFLTSKPSSMAGLKTNSIKVGEDFHFPAGTTWIEFDRNAGTERYAIIYSSTPLTSPAFLNKETEYELTPDDHKAWEDFRAKALIASTSITSGEEPAVAVLLPKSKADGQPFIFEVSIDHK